jgi:wyosine [tRNA(Phe)-imidazoG37] synthetase (radical SAM superfamily)
MSDVLPLKTGIIYGPVRSRRLGRSLGINLLPPGRKWCTFDCLYCQYGWTPDPSGALAGHDGLPTLRDVVEALEAALRELAPSPAYLTFSGNGEPTLHPDFPGIVEAVMRVRNRLAPEADLALLSNASLAGEANVRAAVLEIDRPIMKLDAGNEAVFHAFSRPAQSVDYGRVVSGLGEIPGITLQALFAAGPSGNLGTEHVEDWVQTVRRIRPRDVQLYTISRPVPCRLIEPAPRGALVDIQGRLSRAGISAEVF